MKFAFFSLPAAFALMALLSQSEPLDASVQRVGAPQAALSQSRASAIMKSLDSWTLKSGERPKASRLARDCMGASAMIMNDGSTGVVNQQAMPAMGFWSSILGAVVIEELKNGNDDTQTDEDTAYRRMLKNQRGGAGPDIPYFVRDYFVECESIRKQFGG